MYACVSLKMCVCVRLYDRVLLGDSADDRVEIKVSSCLIIYS